VFKPPKAIRGGIPICFPQFSDLGPLDTQHGFARNERWDIVAQTSDSVTMRLASTPASLAKWPHAFEATYAVALEADGGLATTFEVKNLGAEPMRFTTALHTYFRVSSVAGAKVTGLRGVKYLDQLDGSKSGLTDKDGLVGWERKTEEAEAVTFEREVDRVYLGVPSRGVAIVDAARGAEVTLATENLPDAVVWNPWIDKSKATGDLGDEDYKAFVCVEAAAVERPAEVKPGETWRCKQVLARNAA
jgi:glucose-6-phosphate 1-epimerase